MVVKELSNYELVYEIERIIKEQRKNYKFLSNEGIEDRYFELIEEEKSRIEEKLIGSFELPFITVMVIIQLQFDRFFKNSFKSLVKNHN